MKAICCMFNFPSHYRKNIYKLIESEFNSDFYFGDKPKDKIKMLSFDIFNKPHVLYRTRKLGWLSWNPDSIKHSFNKSYSTYILTGEMSCLSTWYTLILNRMLSKKTYLWSHCWYGDETPVRAFVTKIYLRLASGLFVYGNYAKELLISEGFKEDVIHVIYNSLDYDEQLKIRKDLKFNNVYNEYFGNDYPVVIFTGRLTLEKKIDQLIDAHKILLNQGVPFNVLLLGDGEDSQRLKKIVRKADIESFFWFYGACYDENVIGNLFYNATVCVSPGNVGLTAIHAMSYGCPVIAHSTFNKQGPEFEAIEPAVTGDFFEKDNVFSLAEKIKYWLAVTNKSEVSASCFNVIDSKYNPNNQLEILKKVIH